MTNVQTKTSQSRRWCAPTRVCSATPRKSFSLGSACQQAYIQTKRSRNTALPWPEKTSTSHAYGRTARHPERNSLLGSVSKSLVTGDAFLQISVWIVCRGSRCFFFESDACVGILFVFAKKKTWRPPARGRVENHGGASARLQLLCHYDCYDTMTNML